PRVSWRTSRAARNASRRRRRATAGDSTTRSRPTRHLTVSSCAAGPGRREAPWPEAPVPGGDGMGGAQGRSAHAACPLPVGSYRVETTWPERTPATSTVDDVSQYARTGIEALPAVTANSIHTSTTVGTIIGRRR